MFGEEAGELIGRVVAEHNAGHQQNVQAAEKMLGSKVGMPPQPRDPATQQFVAKPPMTDEQRLDARDNEILDEILGTDDESEFGDEAPGEAQSEDAVLDQILDGKMTPEAQRRRGMDAAERRRQAGYSAVDGVGRVGMKPRENPGFEIMR